MNLFAYIGSRTAREKNARGDGITVFKRDAKTGHLELVQVVDGLVNPSFLAINQANTRLYSVHGDMDYVSSFVINRDTGQLTFLNQQSCNGRNPVHLALDHSESFLVVSNYTTGNLAVLPLNEDGSLALISQEIQLTGTPGPHRVEQVGPRPHSNPFDPSGRFVLIPDKGLDLILSYEFKDGQLTPSKGANGFCRAASGPRHLSFHPSKPWVYVTNEIDSTVATYVFDELTGGLAPFQITTSLSDSYTGNNTSAEIEISAKGDFLYVSNRGEDCISVFEVDQESGRINLIQNQSTLGKTPRFFCLDPSGHFLYALNEESDNIVLFGVDQSTGLLHPLEYKTSVGSPVCMIFGSSTA